MQAEVNILSGTSPCPSARPGGSGGVVLICSLGRGWARVSGNLFPIAKRSCPFKDDTKLRREFFK